MAISHRYADFGQGAFAEVSESVEALEDVKLDAFESGYQAGWDDAVKAHAAETDKVTSEISQRLEDMSFTYHEVYVKLALALKPLMVNIVNKLLPDIAKQSLHAHILQEVSALIDAKAENAVEIAVSPVHLAAIGDIIQKHLSLPFSIVAEPSLTSGQVYVRVGQAEREIDLDAVLRGISEAVEAFFEQVTPETLNG